MNELEERLRAEMFDATNEVYADLNLEAVVASGDRVRNGRAVRQSLGAVAAAVTLGLVAYAGFSSRPVVGVPAPAATVTASGGPSPSISTIPSDPLSTTFDIGGEINGQVPSYDSIRVAVSPEGESTRITVTLTPVNGEAVDRHYTIKARTFWHVALDGHTVIGIVPDRVSRLSAQGGAGNGVLTSEQPLDGIGATAFWEGFLQAGAPEAITGFIWEGSDARVYDSLGNTVPSVRIPLKGRQYLIYRDAALDIMTAGPTAGGTSWGTNISDMTPKGMLGGGAGSEDPAGTWTWTNFGALPPGAHDISVTLAPGDAEWASKVLSDGYTVILATNTSRSAHADVIRSVTYTDASGRVVHYAR